MCTVLRGASLLVLSGFLALAAPSSGHAQAPTTTAQLESEAQRLFLAGTTAQCLRAATLWRRAADQYLANGWTTDGAAALRSSGRALSCAGADSAALGYYGRAAELDNAMASHQLTVLLEESPVASPAGRGVQEDARFVGAVNRLLVTLTPGDGTGSAPRVTSAEDAQRALEDLAGLRLAPITVRSSGGPMEVQVRRWIYSVRQPGAPWERLTTDTTVRRSPAAYDFRYRDRTTGRDTTITNLCADGCTMVIR